MSRSTFHLGDAGNFDKLAGPESLDCIVQDPPAGIAFMGASFDRSHGGRDAWIKLHAGLFAAGRRACKPGAWSLTWALPRTSHWTACALDDAGWEITDCVTHLNGQGWPKNARTQLKPASEHWYLARNGGGGSLQIDASRVARGAEPITAHRASGQKFGGGFAEPYQPGDHLKLPKPGGSWPTNLVLSHCEECEERGTREVKASAPQGTTRTTALGRMSDDSWQPKAQPRGRGMSDPNGLETVAAFACLASCSCGLSTLAPSGGQPPRCDCGEAMAWRCPVAELDRQSGTIGASLRAADRSAANGRTIFGADGKGYDASGKGFTDSGGASRFFPTFAYAAKASTSERHAGAEHLRWARDASTSLGWREVDREDYEQLRPEARATGNIHPTVKSLKLARWLVRLLCPPGGRGGDPFCGSGSIGIAAALEGFDWISSDLSPEAIRIAQARLAHWQAEDAKPVKAPAVRRVPAKAAPIAPSPIPRSTSAQQSLALETA